LIRQDPFLISRPQGLIFVLTNEQWSREEKKCLNLRPVPEFIDPVFAKTSPKRSFSVIENVFFGLVFVKTGPINSGTGIDSANLRWPPIPSWNF
jgi:hypothetical protein